MATISLNKSSSKLSTRNSFTGRAMERITKDKLKQLLTGNLNYLSWEEKYIQRRFYPNKYLQNIRKQRRDIFKKEKQKHKNSSNNHLTHLKQILQQEEQNDLKLQKRFQSFIAKHNGNKPLLILDVDNTMLYVRFFSEELQINDICTYFSSPTVSKNNSKIIKIRLTLSLEITNNEIIDIIGKETINYIHWVSTNKELKQYHKHGLFLCTIDNFNDIKCKINNIEVTGCIIQVNDSININNEIEIDFTMSNNKLNKFEPMTERKGMIPVDFIYEGFLVRLRPNLDEFMEYIIHDFDVVIYTAADKKIYNGLLKMVQMFINQALGRDNNDILWNDILFRDDCILKYDFKGKPFHHKDLTLFGCDLSRVIIVDNSPIVCHGLEPNFILIKDYFGKDNNDDELMEVYQLLDVIAGIKGDIRYFLCGLEHEESMKSMDLMTDKKCLKVSKQLMKEMKEFYKEQIKDETLFKFNDEKEDIDVLELPTRDRDGSYLILTPKQQSIRGLDVIKKEKLEYKQKLSRTRRAYTAYVKPMFVKKLIKDRRKSACLMVTMAPKPEVMNDIDMNGGKSNGNIKKTSTKRRRNSSVFNECFDVNINDKNERIKVNDRIIVFDNNLYFNLSMKHNIV